MTKPIVNLDELEYRKFGKGERFSAERAPVSSRIGAQKLGYAVVRLEPGKCAWPYHSHHVNEEMFYVLEGEGTLRHADEEYPIRAGDFICSPADPKQAHQIVNTSDRELCYLALSTEEPTDVLPLSGFRQVRCLAQHIEGSEGSRQFSRVCPQRGCGRLLGRGERLRVVSLPRAFTAYRRRLAWVIDKRCKLEQKSL